MVFRLTALAVLPMLAAAAAMKKADTCHKLDGVELPKHFVYGCGTSAYQIEGAYNVDGKGQSVWDKFVEKKDAIANGDTGRVAMDFYHTYKTDLPLFKKALGINAYDFTISWPRILPDGTGSTPNEKGIGFYKDMIKTVHDNGMTASCTLYHWDLPQKLQDAYKGWIGDKDKIVKDFENYARVTMTALGASCDRWISVNEPRTFCTEGYSTEPDSAPGYEGDAIDPFRCVHNVLLAHSAAHKVYKELEEMGKVRGGYGIKADGGYPLPLNPNSDADKKAVERDAEFNIGWIVAPLTTGDYPASIRDTLGDKLPKFTAEESAALKDSYDVIWYDGYTRNYAGAIKGKCEESNEDANWPTCVEETSDRNKKPIGKPTGSDWNFLVPETLYTGLHYMHDKLGVKALAVGETGLTLKNRKKHSLKWQLNDHDRVEWYQNSLRDVKRLVQEGFPLVGFVPWSCISNFEWSQGFEGDFGLIYAEAGVNKPRTPKLSSMYLKDVMTNNEPIDSKKYARGSKTKVVT